MFGYILAGDGLQGAAGDCNSPGVTHAWFDSRVAHHFSKDIQAGVMSDAIWQLAGLFILSFSAATLLPGGSEAALLGMAALSAHSLTTLLIVASVGNTLGSVLNYALGRLALHYRERKWFPISAPELAKAQRWFERWGQWSVLLAWAPVIGDPLTFAAGVMRMHFGHFIVLVAISKTVRYMAVLGLFKLFW
jgi:membrane protein YqaA with SNARE-associated domain